MPTNKTRDTLVRHWELLKRLPSRGAGKTAGQLAQELRMDGFPISKRQVERDLGLLSEVFHLDCNNRSIPYGWKWQSGASVEVPGLTAAEALSLHVVQTQLQQQLPASLLEGLQARFQQAQRKLASLPPDSLHTRWRHKVRSVPPTQPLLPPQIDAQVLSEVQEALLQEVQLDVDYQAVEETAAKTMCLHPLGLVNRGPITYLVATAWTYDDIRLYALHRLQRAACTARPIHCPEHFSLADYLERGALQFGEGRLLPLVARVSPTLARILAETPLATDQTLHDQQLTATVADTWQLQWWLLSQGEAIEVLGPSDLRERIRDSLEQALAAYSRELDTLSTGLFP